MDDKASIVTGIIRHFLTMAGGALVAGGVIDAGTSSGFINDFGTVVGLLTSMAGVGWSIWSKISAGGL